MQKITGMLKELGDSTESNRTPFWSYSYLEVGDRTLKKVQCFKGLDGKLRLQVGKQVTLFFKGTTIVAIQTEEGKLFSSEKTTLAYVLAVGFVALGIPFSVVLIGFPMILFGLYLAWFGYTVNSGAKLPNAIQLPR